MSKIVLLISHDKKAIGQVSRWLKELPDDVAFETAASLDELQDKYLARPRLEAAEGEGEAASEEDVLRLVIFDVAMFGSSDPIDFISQSKLTLQKSRWCSAEAPLKVMILSFDNAALPIKTFVNEEVDDLLMKPLDHQLFLQKAGMMLADKGKTEGSFLFKQKAKFTVEMAKEVRVVKLSEFGLVISNPSPIAPGVFAHLYSPIFGAKSKSSVWGRVFDTRRDPKVIGNYLCFFTFFGIQADQLMNYRRVLRDRRKELRFHSTGYDRNRTPAAVRHVAIIERNQTNSSLISEALSTNFLNLKTYTFSSYAQFLKAVSGSAITSVPSKEETAEAAKPFIGSTISFIVRSDTAELVKTDPPVRDESHFCGVPLEDLIASNKWLDLLVPSEKDEWEEFLLTLQRGSKSQASLYFKNTNGDHHSLLLKGETAKSSDEGSKTLRLEIRELSREEIEIENDKRRKEQAVFPQVDAIYIDASSIREFTPWYESAKDTLRKANLLIGERLPICLLVDEKAKVSLENYRLKTVSDLIYKPIDRRFLIAKSAVLISDLVSASDNVDLSFTPADMPIKIAKEVELNEIAEFGFLVKSNIPLKENIFLRFFSPIFLDESGEGVLGRCTSCTPDESEQGESYGCFFTLFGVSDTQLKHIRNWIREDYVSKKDSAAG